jgi:D-cysteine desulfhydrase
MVTETWPTTPAALGTWPTPLEPAPRLAQALGLGPADLWIKRDDLTGLGAGGNKVRKLEWICGAAVAGGADALVTCGASQSNHARLTAAAGARLGLDVVLVLAGTRGGSESGNIALDGLLGATVVWAGDVAHEELKPLAVAVVDQLRRQGGHPVLIPYGGSSALGARGYVECGHELLAQAPDLTTVVTAVGSGGTMAGLVHALGPPRVLGVDCGAVSQPALTVAELVAQLSGAPLSPGALRIRIDQVGAGYAELTEPVLSALTLAARTEGLIMDPIYTGRALAGLVSAVDEHQIKPGEQTIFLHSGGLPGLFGHPVTVSRSTAKLTEFSPAPS